MRLRAGARSARADLHRDAALGRNHRLVRPDPESTFRSRDHFFSSRLRHALSFSIDIERDPQSDDFHGLWEDLGSGKALNISGKGSGVVRGAEVTGTFDGVFALYDPLDPPRPGTLFTAHYCKARDHQFRFVKQ